MEPLCFVQTNQVGVFLGGEPLMIWGEARAVEFAISFFSPSQPADEFFFLANRSFFKLALLNVQKNLFHFLFIIAHG